MAGLLSGTVMDESALLLNDPAKLVFTYVIQAPWLRKAVDSLSDELAVNGIPISEKITSPITPTIGGGITTIPTPSDCLYPMLVEERTAGSSEDWVQMVEMDRISPNITPETAFGTWAFQGTMLNSAPVLDVPNATTTREIRLTYQRFLVSGTITDGTFDFSTTLMFNCKRYLSARTAEYITRFILKDRNRADEVKGETAEAITRLIQIWVHKRQNRPVRKPGFNKSRFKRPLRSV